MRRFLASFLLTGLLAPSPASAQPVEPVQVSARTLSGFGLDLFRELSASSEEPNVVFSPLSAGLAFALLQEGAKEETLAELRTALGIDAGSLQDFHAGVPELTRSLASDTTVEIRIGTSMWVTEERRLDPGFRTRGQETYDARVARIDFQDEADLQRINEWASEETAGKIPTVIRPPVEDEMALLLLNAVYFKGLWASPFDTTATKPEPFARSPGDTIDVPTMRRTDEVGYLEVDGVRGVRLPYQGDRFAAWILLPAETSSVAELERALDPDTIAAWAVRFTSRDVAIQVPRFLHRGRWDLQQPLEELGVRRAFDRGRAQLEPIWAPEHRGNPPSYVTDAFQATFIRFDEEGTEAAAVTGIGISVTSVPPPPVPFVVDRPFLVLLRDDESGAVLFVARVGDPSDAGRG